MTTKRKRRKPDTEAAQKAALRQRLHDFMLGATGGGYFDGSDEYTFLGNDANAVSTFLICVRDVLGYNVNLAELSHFNSFQGVVDHLYSSGVRADSKPKDEHP